MQVRHIGVDVAANLTAILLPRQPTNPHESQLFSTLVLETVTRADLCLCLKCNVCRWCIHLIQIISQPASFTFTVQLLRKIDRSRIKSRVVSNIINLDQLKRVIPNKSVDPVDSDELEIIDSHFVVSLTCPLTLLPVTTPVRGIKCLHFGCIDLDSLIESSVHRAMNASTKNTSPTLVCPLCNNRISLQELGFCQLTRFIQSMAPENESSCSLSFKTDVVDVVWSESKALIRLRIDTHGFPQLMSHQSPTSTLRKLFGGVEHAWLLFATTVCPPPQFYSLNVLLTRKNSILTSAFFECRLNSILSCESLYYYPETWILTSWLKSRYLIQKVQLKQLCSRVKNAFIQDQIIKQSFFGRWCGCNRTCIRWLQSIDIVNID